MNYNTPINLFYVRAFIYVHMAIGEMLEMDDAPPEVYVEKIIEICESRIAAEHGLCDEATREWLHENGFFPDLDLVEYGSGRPKDSDGHVIRDEYGGVERPERGEVKELS